MGVVFFVLQFVVVVVVVVVATMVATATTDSWVAWPFGCCTCSSSRTNLGYLLLPHNTIDGGGGGDDNSNNVTSHVGGVT